MTAKIKEKERKEILATAHRTPAMYAWKINIGNLMNKDKMDMKINVI